MTDEGSEISLAGSFENMEEFSKDFFNICEKHKVIAAFMAIAIEGTNGVAFRSGGAPGINEMLDRAVLEHLEKGVLKIDKAEKENPH